jgi:hypothetical protein
MEAAVSTRIKAAQTDNAEVDLSQWAEPKETQRVANARAVLRRLAVKWWAHHQEKLVLQWLKGQGYQETADDVADINDCIRLQLGCTYWSWTRVSQIFFWKLPEK